MEGQKEASKKAVFMETVRRATQDAGRLQVLTVAVQLPTGAIETITNTQDIQAKVDYYENAYDDDMHLKANSQVRIIGYMAV